jgi:hypothetical protein
MATTNPSTPTDPASLLMAGMPAPGEAAGQGQGADDSEPGPEQQHDPDQNEIPPGAGRLLHGIGDQVGQDGGQTRCPGEVVGRLVEPIGQRADERDDR